MTSEVIYEDTLRRVLRDTVTRVRSVELVDPPRRLPVTEYGASGGSASERAQIQSAIDDLSTDGGGVVELAGSHVLDGALVVPSDITVAHGRLTLAAGANSPAVKSEGYDDLVGTDVEGNWGPSGFGLHDVVIDGNKAAQTGSSAGVAIFGHDYRLSNVRVYDAAGDGIFSQWNTYAGVPGNTGMETRLTDVKAYNCGRDGVRFDGPHDSVMDGVFAIDNVAVGINLSARSTGTMAMGCHSYGVTQQYAWVAGSDGLILTGCVGEGATAGQLHVMGNSVGVHGGAWFVGVQPTRKGIILGDATTSPTQTMMHTRVYGCNDGALDVTYDGGGMLAQVIANQGTATTLVGTPHATSMVQMVESDGASNSRVILPGSLSVGGKTLVFNPDNTVGWS